MKTTTFVLITMENIEMNWLAIEESHARVRSYTAQAIAMKREEEKLFNILIYDMVNEIHLWFLSTFWTFIAVNGM